MAQKAKALRTAPAKGPKKSRKPGVKAGSSEASALERYKLFAEGWLANGGNATQAAKDAGYSAKTAYSQGQRLLKHVDVVRLIREGQARLRGKFELQTEAVLAELAKLTFSDARDLYDFDGNLKPIHLWPDHAAAAVSTIKPTRWGIEVKCWNKSAAVSDSMKHLGLFEKDNRQKVDPVAQLMQHIAEHDTGLPVRP